MALPGGENSSYITIARITKTQGRHGELAADILTDFPEKFAERKQLSLLLPGGKRRAVQLTSHWFHKDRVVLKFFGVENISDAQSFIDAEVQIPVEQRVPRVHVEAEGSFYIDDLIGCQVFDQGRAIGKVTQVQFGAGAAPLLVLVDPSGEEHDIPFASEYLACADVAKKTLDFNLPEGMLDINQPVIEEGEKLHR